MEVTVQPCNDRRHIEAILGRRDLCRAMCETGKETEMKTNLRNAYGAPRWIFLDAYRDKQWVGQFYLIDQGAHIWELHTAMLEQGRGFTALRCGRAMLEWLFTHTSAEAVVTPVPADNPAAGILARAVGFARMSTFERCWRKRDQFLDLIQYGISRGEYFSKKGTQLCQ
jgi:RimJ/RimL family protein N-acetyltransferase